MGKMYGARWRLVGDRQLGKGGQSDVFVAVDTTGVLEGEYALKRVLNPKRHERFRNEVEAIKRLSHPNIIKLIDHSALSETAKAEETQFLVMPIAKDGDLSRAERLAYYKGSVEAVLQVAKQIAGGLEAAHAAGVVHRDIKPQNILFTGNGHEIWIADFGICLLREGTRPTEMGEVVGPRAFMAPELEGGGQLAVTPSADVYSLGKVIYFMFSGGVVIPREQVHEAGYAGVLDGSERSRLLRNLLGQMICEQKYRISSMADIIRRIEDIENWEKKAKLLPINQFGLDAIDKLQRQARNRVRAHEEWHEASNQYARAVTVVKDTFLPWLKQELEIAAQHISNGATLSCHTTELPSSDLHQWRATYSNDGFYATMGGVELRLKQPADWREHLLEVRICNNFAPAVKVASVRADGQDSKSPAAQEHNPRDPQLAMIPFYRGHAGQWPPNFPKVAGFLTKPEFIGGACGQRQPSITHLSLQQGVKITSQRVAGVTQGFHFDYSLFQPFAASQWPGNEGELHDCLTQTIRAFLDYVATDAKDVSA